MKRGFTLAETLITLLVIGVIAVLTIPALIQQIGDYTLSKQRTVFSRKFEEGLKQMRIDGRLEEKYADTNEFVAAMKKYFKISQV
ncbi:MAG: type II secretion system GspH family protein [bacterium]|nr:type II secretion system GspH family protein [bacterium]